MFNGQIILLSIVPDTYLPTKFNILNDLKFRLTEKGESIFGRPKRKEKRNPPAYLTARQNPYPKFGKR